MGRPNWWRTFDVGDGRGQHRLGRGRGCRRPPRRPPGRAGAEPRRADHRRTAAPQRRRRPRRRRSPRPAAGSRRAPAAAVTVSRAASTAPASTASSARPAAATGRRPTASGTNSAARTAGRRRAGTARSDRDARRGTAPAAMPASSRSRVLAGLPARSAHRPPAPRRRGSRWRSAARPISSQMTATSANVAPAPPRCSGTSRPVQPACASRPPASRHRPVLGEQIACHRAQFVVDSANSRGHHDHARFPGQAEAALGDDGALDLAGPAGNRPLPRADEVQHPRAGLPAARHRLGQLGVGGQPADLGAEVGHPLQQFAVEQLDDRRVGRPDGAASLRLAPGRGTVRAGR